MRVRQAGRYEQSHDLEGFRAIPSKDLQLVAYLDVSDAREAVVQDNLSISVWTEPFPACHDGPSDFGKDRWESVQP